MKAVDNEPVPRHFFVYPEERNLNPWALFRLLKPRWQAITAAVAGLFILASIGGVMSFTRSEIDVAALEERYPQSRRAKEPGSPGKLASGSAG